MQKGQVFCVCEWGCCRAVLPPCPLILLRKQSQDVPAALPKVGGREAALERRAGMGNGVGSSQGSQRMRRNPRLQSKGNVGDVLLCNQRLQPWGTAPSASQGELLDFCLWPHMGCFHLPPGMGSNQSFPLELLLCSKRVLCLSCDVLFPY